MGLQIGARGITNRGSFRNFKSGQGFQIEENQRFQIRAEITNRGKRDYKLEQRFKIGAGITNRDRTNV